ncbi:hypothetical protein PRUPE_3G211000 [Prunus persica]|uniref:AUGMIN subunit 2 n=1 Tax=Prunus persica TaxID=3760 RepID=A0A251Q6Q4_PRUPE|nr:hypothetical protein PRUPE_3G211000 [Prunus persica]
MGFVCVLGHNLAQYNRPRNSGLKNGSYSSVHSAGQSSPCKGLNFFSALPSLKARRRKWWLEGQSNCWCSLKCVVGCVGMSMGSDSTWVGKKPLRRIGGMSDALSIASDLGFSVAAPPTQEELQNLSTTTGEKGDDLIKVLRELTSVQRKIADLQVELQGRKDDKNVAHLTHASEMEKKCETLARITTILKDVIQNKDRIIARLQQPYSLDCIPVEAEYQKQFSELLMKAASDYGALTASVADFQWSQTFKEPPSVWGKPNIKDLINGFMRLYDLP